MNSNKKKLMAVGAAGLVGIAGYGVYATTLNISSTNAFSAGTGQQDDGCVREVQTTVTPKLVKGQYVVTDLHVAGDFKGCTNGAIMQVKALGDGGKVLGAGFVVIDPKSEAKGYDVELFTGSGITDADFAEEAAVLQQANQGGQQQLAQANGRLSSGTRINSGQDDAAGLVIRGTGIDANAITDWGILVNGGTDQHPMTQEEIDKAAAELAKNRGKSLDDMTPEERAKYEEAQQVLQLLR